MTGLAFTAAPLSIAILVALAAMGAWVTWASYFRTPFDSLAGGPVRAFLAVVTALAWIALVWFGAGPRLRRTPAVYHPPAVALVLDASGSHAALGARASAEKALNAARAHYEAAGFKVLEFSFAERLVAGRAPDADAGELTSFAALARALDSSRVPNLRAIVLATDGRASLDGAAAAWPAPVYPLVPGGGRGLRAEAQGERAELDWTRPEEGADLRVTWSAASHARAISAELRENGRTLWSGVLRKDTARGPGDGAHWNAVESEFRLPGSLTRGARPHAWTLRVRPEPNPSRDNDAVELRLKGWGGARDLVARPLSSLEERGLLDALRFGDSGAVFVGEFAVSGAGAEDRAEDVWWVRAGRALPGGTAGTVLEYRIARFVAENAREGFGAGARVRWRDDGAEFLPAGVVRLGDLGVEEGKRALVLPPESREAEVLAWAEQDGRKGLLLWRRPGTRVFGAALPPLWNMGSLDPSEARAAASGWTRGASAWARAQGRARVSLPDPVIAGRRFALEARFPREPEFENISRYDLYENGSRVASARGAGLARFDSVTLRAGTRALSIRRGSRVVWTGAARAFSPRELESRRLGFDRRALADIAGASDGNIIRHDIGSKISWPALPAGQARETRARAITLAPAALALAVALLLCVAWGMRKKLQLD